MHTKEVSYLDVAGRHGLQVESGEGAFHGDLLEQSNFISILLAHP